MKRKIQNDLCIALKVGNVYRISALRILKSEIEKKEKPGTGPVKELTDDEIVGVIRKTVAQYEESGKLYHDAGKETESAEEYMKASFLKDYLPKILSEDELHTVIDEIIKEMGVTSIKDMGKVMKELSAKYPNRYDGKTASNHIKVRLS